jgi:hypothetical protein
VTLFLLQGSAALAAGSGAASRYLASGPAQVLPGAPQIGLRDRADRSLRSSWRCAQPRIGIPQRQSEGTAAMTNSPPPPGPREPASPAVLVPALVGGCLPLVGIFIAALVVPAALVAGAAWLFGLSDAQQVAAAVIVVGAEIVLLIIASLFILAKSPFFDPLGSLTLEDEDDADGQAPF